MAVNEDDCPHLSIATDDGNAHVIPLITMEMAAAGGIEIEDIHHWRPIMRAIIKDWLDLLEQEEDDEHTP